MPLFGKKEPVYCDICGNDTAGFMNKRKAKDGGVFCATCLNTIIGGSQDINYLVSVDNMTIAQLKEQLSMREAQKDEFKNHSFEARIGGLLIDYENKKWAIQMMTLKGLNIVDTDETPRVYDFDEILDVALVVDEETITEIKKKGGVGRAIVGGVLTGGVGAVVGAVTAKEKLKTKTTINKAGISVKLDKQPIEQLYYPLTGTSKFVNVYAGTLDEGAQMVDEFNRMIKISAEAENVVKDNADNTTDKADELRKYKALLDDGIITQDDFDNKKKQLLDL